MFCCVVVLCSDNLREAWGTDTEWLLNVEAISFIYLVIFSMFLLISER